MAGLAPAIHVFFAEANAWMPGTRPGMTSEIGVVVLFIQKIQHSRLRQHGLGGAVLFGAQALLGGAGARLQIGAEVARAFDDAPADADAQGFEARKAALDVAAIRDRLGERDG